MSTDLTNYERGDQDWTGVYCQHCLKPVRGDAYVLRRYNAAGTEVRPHALHTACYHKLDAARQQTESARQAAQHVPAGMTLLRSRYTGVCAASGRPIHVGDAIYWSRETGAVLVAEYREDLVSRSSLTDVEDDDHGEGRIVTSVGGSESDAACGSY
jgi:hypothetical protein